jgi:predicted DNA-binding protein
MSAPGKQVTVRLPPEQHEQIEALRKSLSTEHVTATTADALRVVVKNGLANLAQREADGRPER